MAIETEVKFQTDVGSWQAILADYRREHAVLRVENQRNQYYNTKGNELNERKIGLRLRVLEDRSILTIKWDTKEQFKRVEIEEAYEDLLEHLPPSSQALQKLLQDIGCCYEDVVPWVSIATERTLFHLQQGATEVEVCFDEVTIEGQPQGEQRQAHQLYEIEFELLTGDEAELMQMVEQFKQRYGDRVEVSSTPKLRRAIEWLAAVSKEAKQ